MEHKSHLVDDPANPKVAAPPPPQPVVNGDIAVMRRDSRPGTPQTSHRSVTFVDTPVRDSLVFDKIAGYSGCEFYRQD